MSAAMGTMEPVATACQQCRGEIPLDSSFCPLCGARVELAGDATLLDMPPASASAAVAAPLATPLPAPRTMRLEAVPPIWQPPPAHAPPWPAPAPAPHGVPGAIPRSPRIGRIATGALALVGAVVLLIAVLADPASPAFGLPAPPDEVRVFLRVAALFLTLFGVAAILTGALHRDHAHVVCRRCRQPVVAWKGSMGLVCPAGGHYARVAWGVVGFTAAFWLGAVGGGLALLVWLAG